jgi:hypothetical protein
MLASLGKRENICITKQFRNQPSNAATLRLCCPRSGEGSSRDQEEAQARERLVRGSLAADRLRKPKQRNRHLLLLSSLACLWHTIW